MMNNPDPHLDRGWAIPLLLAGTVGFALIFGVSYSSAIFYVVFLDVFGRSAADTAWVVALNTCTTYISQPVASLVSKRLGAAWSVTIGCVLSSVGLLSSTFMNNILGLCLTFGLMTGFGWAFVSIGVFHGLFLFFSRYRQLAIALTTLGISIGQFIYPPILELLFSHYDWRGAILILSAINLNLLVIAAILIAGRAKHKRTLESESFVSEAQSGTTEVVLQSHLVDIKEALLLAVDPWFLLVNLSTILVGLAISAFQTHITRAALLAGHDNFFASMLPAVIGASGILGRIVWGTVAHKMRQVGVVWLTVLSYLLLVLPALLCIFLRTSAALVASCFLCGFLIGVWAVLPEVLAAVAGIGRIVNALGLNGLFCGFGLLIGPPFVAWLSEADPSYRLSFGLTSVFFFLSFMLLLPSAIKRKPLE